MRIICFIIAVMAVTAAPAAAFRMSPIELVLSPSGAGSARSITLDNPTEAPMAVELTAHFRDMAVSGEDVLSPAGDSLIVVPSQVVLMPGDRQVVRLQWAGGPLETEKALRLIAEQLPINLDEEARDGGRVRLLVRYVASLYVQPDQAKPALTYGAGRVEEEEEGSVLRFPVENTGNAHISLSNLSVQVQGTDGNDLLSLAREQLQTVSGAVVLAGRTREFTVPLSDTVAAQSVRVELDYGTGE